MGKIMLSVTATDGDHGVINTSLSMRCSGTDAIIILADILNDFAEEIANSCGVSKAGVLTKIIESLPKVEAYKKETDG